MIYILDCIPHFSIHMDAIIFCCTVMGYLGADVFGRCTDSNRLQANDWANTASQLILAHRRRNFARLQKDSERAAQPNFNLCAAADLAGQQRQRKGHFVGIGRWTSLPAKTGSQTRPPTTAGIFQGTAGVERVVGGGIGCVVKCHCLSQADMSLDRQA